MANLNCVQVEFLTKHIYPGNWPKFNRTQYLWPRSFIVFFVAPCRILVTILSLSTLSRHLMGRLFPGWLLAMQISLLHRNAWILNMKKSLKTSNVLGKLWCSSLWCHKLQRITCFTCIRKQQLRARSRTIGIWSSNITIHLSINWNVEGIA